MQPSRELTPPRAPTPQVLGSAIVDAAFDALLKVTPALCFMAIDENGRRVEMPASVELPADRIITNVDSALELCVPNDIAAIVEAWYKVLAVQGANALVHLRSDPQTTVTLHFLDIRERHGVLLSAIAANKGFIDGLSTHGTVFAPKLCAIIYDNIGVIETIDSATTKILGWTLDELHDTRALELVHVDERNSAIAKWMEMLGRPGGEHRAVVRYRHRSGNYIWFEITYHNYLSDPLHPHVRGELLDISERMEAIEALRVSEQRLRRLTEALPIGVIEIDMQRNIVYHNESLGGIFGVRAARTLTDLFALAEPADSALLLKSLDTIFDFGTPADIELTVAAALELRRYSIGMRALDNDRGKVTGAILCVADITERARMRSELEIRAKYDTLTHCHNRLSILDTLQTVLAESVDAGMAVLFIDLDRFKHINDEFGHAAGDELLRQIGKRLAQCVRTIDVVGRLGGDEFLIVCPEVPSPTVALEIGRRVAASIAEPLDVGTATLVPGASIGIAWANAAIDMDKLVASADEAMYESKRGSHDPVLNVAATLQV